MSSFPPRRGLSLARVSGSVPCFSWVKSVNRLIFCGVSFFAAARKPCPIGRMTTRGAVSGGAPTSQQHLYPTIHDQLDRFETTLNNELCDLEQMGVGRHSPLGFNDSESDIDPPISGTSQRRLLLELQGAVSAVPLAAKNRRIPTGLHTEKESSSRRQNVRPPSGRGRGGGGRGRNQIKAQSTSKGEFDNKDKPCHELPLESFPFHLRY